MTYPCKECSEKHFCDEAGLHNVCKTLIEYKRYMAEKIKQDMERAKHEKI